MSKLISLSEAVSAIPDGAMIALGGNTLNRAPMAAVYELARQRKSDLRLVKTAGAMDVDLLCLANAAASVDAGFISYENRFGLCPHYRKGVQQGLVKSNEHACYTVISALRASAYGLPFMPVKGLKESDLRRAHPYFASAKDPFTGEELAAVRALRPDWAIIHVQQADARGNARIDGPVYEDLLMSQAAQKVLITAEEIVDDGFFSRCERKAQIPHFLTDAVVLKPRGASPCSCTNHYQVDEAEILSFLALADGEALLLWLSESGRAQG